MVLFVYLLPLPVGNLLLKPGRVLEDRLVQRGGADWSQNVGVLAVSRRLLIPPLRLISFPRED